MPEASNRGKRTCEGITLWSSWVEILLQCRAATDSSQLKVICSETAQDACGISLLAVDADSIVSFSETGPVEPKRQVADRLLVGV
jgi:hypothetical protein